MHTKQVSKEGTGRAAALPSSDGRIAKNENDLMQCHKRFDSVQLTSRYLINSLIFVKPVNDNVYVSNSPVCL